VNTPPGICLQARAQLFRYQRVRKTADAAAAFSSISRHYGVKEDYSTLRLQPVLNFRIARPITISNACCGARGYFPKTRLNSTA
jgi:hypothetical protein